MKAFWKLCGIVGLFSCLVAPVWSQTTDSTLRGTVTDGTGAVLPGVDLTITNLATNVSRTLVTDGFGNYEVPDLLLGVYRITAQMPGFKTAVVDDIQLESAQIRRVNLTLEIGEVSEEITVNAGAAVITTDTAEVSDAFTDSQYDYTHTTKTYYPQSYMVTLAGVDSQQGSWSLRFNGQGPSQISEGMDGVTEDGTVNLINNMLNFTELKVVTVNASAENARVGNFNMVSKSGSNAWHGRVQWQHLNSALNARNFFEPFKTVLIDNRWHGEVSGPIFKDKTFFYVSYFYQDLPGGSFRNATMPTLKMRQGDFSQISKQLINPFSGEPFPNNQIPSNLISPTAQKIQDLYIAQPNQGGPNQIANNLFFEHPYPDDLFRADYPMIRIDHNITDNNSVYGRWTHRHTPYVLKRFVPGMTWTRVRHHDGWAFSDTHVFSPSLVNTFRFGWLLDQFNDGGEVAGVTPLQGHEAVQAIGLQGVNPSNLQGQGFPEIRISGFSDLGTVHGNVGDNKIDDNQFNFNESISWTKGRHAMKFGYDYKYYSYDRGAIPTGTYGFFQFNGKFTGYSYADFMLGLPFWSQRRDPLIPRNQKAGETGIYFTDAFKVTDKLTVNYGLRWDYFGSPYYSDNLMSRWDPGSNRIIVPSGTLGSVSRLYPSSISLVEGEVLPSPDKSNFRPRFGLAYRLDDKMVLRGGYGVYTEQIGTFNLLPGSDPFDIAETYTTNEIVNGVPTFAFPNPFPTDLGAASIPSQSATGYPMETRNGSIHQFNLTLERRVGDLGFRVSYVGSRSRGLNYNVSINKPEASLIPFKASRRPYPQFSSVNWGMTNGKHNYNSFQLEVQKKAGAFTFNANYRLQSSLSNYLNRENPYLFLSGIGSGSLGERDINLWNREQYDSRHKFVLNMSWDIPIGRGRSHLSDIPGVANAVLGGWKFTWVTYLKDGEYFSPAFSGADPSNTNSFGGLPDRVADGNLDPGRREISNWFDVNAFQAPAPGRYGNSGVNILEGPGVHVHHMNLTKRWHVTERLGIELGAAVSNVFNRPHFRFPRNNISASNPGVITVARDSNQDNEKAGQRMFDVVLRITF